MSLLIFQGCKYLFNFLNFKNFTPGLVLHIPKIKEKTRDFMQVCEKSGAEAITVHMRLREERPAEPAHWDEISRLWDAVQVTGGTGWFCKHCWVVRSDAILIPWKQMKDYNPLKTNECPLNKSGWKTILSYPIETK